MVRELQVTRQEWTVVLFWIGWAVLWLALNAPSPLDGVHPSYYAVL
jgi:hypothetical protein